jgi:predicted dehydrogenase
VRGRRISPNEKLNVACIGAGGKGNEDIKGVSGENIVALCDVDRERAAKMFKQYPDAKKFDDFRVMLDKMGNSIDAVTVSAPDHIHAPAAMMAMQMGKHVYCQKPLAHSVWEVRRMTETAARCGVATQMGNQGHSMNGHRRTVELLHAQALGPVREVHVWSDRPIWPQGLDRPTEIEPVPATLNWDLWLGPAPTRPFNHIYVPFNWRGWWDFGCGALGDMGCHNMDVAFWGLKLGAPTSVEAVQVSDKHEETAPKSSVIRWEFPARGKMPPVTMTWYDGGNKPPVELAPEIGRLTNGCLFIGAKGKLLAPDWHADKFQLLPAKDWPGFVGPKETLPRSAGHYEEWIAACKGGPPALSNFSYSGPMTEAVILGNVALRLGKKIEWDSPNMKARNCPEADAFIRPQIPKGWGL